MELVLILNDYFSIVDDSEVDPGTATPKVQASQILWKYKDSKARATIMLHYSDKQFSAVKHLKTSKAICDKLI
jgi:hypothetical protein